MTNIIRTVAAVTLVVFTAGCATTQVAPRAEWTHEQVASTCINKFPNDQPLFEDCVRTYTFNLGPGSNARMGQSPQSQQADAAANAAAAAGAAAVIGIIGGAILGAAAASAHQPNTVIIIPRRCNFWRCW